MLTDRYDMPLSTTSSAARDAFIEGCDLFLALYPGAVAAFDRALAADPGFALAHAGKVQMHIREGDMDAAKASLARANELSAGLPARDASQIGFLRLLLAGQTEEAIAAMRAHLAEWPRDALVLSPATNPNGLIGGSGHARQKHEIAALMDSLATHYGDDWWFLGQHALALGEDGRRDHARAKIARSMELNPRNANGAHAQAHVCYEDGDAAAARAFLWSWLEDYPKDAVFHGHLSWHLSLGEIEAGNPREAMSLYRDAISLDRHSGAAQQKVTDGVGFLWRWELAGHPRDEDAWRATQAFVSRMLPSPSNGLADLHVVLAQSVAGDTEGLEARARRIEELARDGRYPSGEYIPSLSRGFAAFERRDYASAIDTLERVLDQSERIGGSRAQLDLVEFTLLRAYLAADRPDDAGKLVSARRPGPSGIPVAGLSRVH